LFLTNVRDHVFVSFCLIAPFTWSSEGCARPERGRHDAKNKSLNIFNPFIFAFLKNWKKNQFGIGTINFASGQYDADFSPDAAGKFNAN
jgi:hypothetical protein